ncbi:MAG TPA: rhodanese-like domain-containing protein [Ilumatobacter sp.]|nr:rhodanese-like domain-containing protein [Ilumatobacter sp.]
MAIAEITVDELEAELANGARLIDVREVDEYEEFRVPGAVHVPLGSVPEQLEAFDGDGPTYVICLSGARSMRACEYVAEATGRHVINVAGGSRAWVESGRAVETGTP